MKTSTAAATALALAASAQASYVSNMNYFSPSLHHPSMGVSIRKVAARHFSLSSPWNASDLAFTHGVASGDPYSDSVILWTRAAPAANPDNDRSNVTVSGYVELYSHETESYVQHSAAPVCLEWKISETEDLGKVVDSGEVWTSSDIDYTAKVEAKNLKAFTQYWYQFSICSSDNTSPLGRTKTIPAKGSPDAAIKLAVYSCANYPQGFFNAYGNAAHKDSVDFVVHLGDYIYEYANGYYGWGNAMDRIPQPDREIYTLYDYRKRLATYRTDVGLKASHEKFPWIATWDDHEVADNQYRDGSAELNNTEGSFVKDGGVSTDQRKMNAVRAYFEWMPIRQVDMDDNLRIWRSFAFGDLFDLLMLDTRAYDRSITDLYWNTAYVNAIKDDAGRSLMGPRQEAWFYRQLRESSERNTTWRVVGSQVVFSHVNQGQGSEQVNVDAWDGYTANRNRTFKTLYENNIGNNVFLAGDTHVSWVSDVAWLGSNHSYDSATGAGAVGVEFAGTAVSSPSSVVGQNGTLEAANAAAAFLQGQNPTLQWQEGYYRGYFEMEVSREEVTAQFFGLPDIRTLNGLEVSLANFTVKAGGNKLERSVDAVVDAGSLKGGKTQSKGLVHDTIAGEWKAL